MRHSSRVSRFFALFVVVAACSSTAGKPPVAPVLAPEPSESREAPAISPSERLRKVESFPAPPYAYELSILRGASPSDMEPFVVRLIKDGRAIDEVALWGSSCAANSLRPAVGVRGGDRESRSWTTDLDECDTRVAARTVELSAGATGLLLTEATGHEYRYSVHYLFLAHRDRLAEVWTYSESMLGEQRSSTSVIPSDAPGRQDIAFLRVERSDAAQVTAQRLRFEPASLAMTASALPDEKAPLFLLAVGNFEDASAARKAQNDCVYALDVLQRALFPDLPTPKFYFGGVFARRKDADQAAAELADCPGLPKPTIYEQRWKANGTTHP